MVVKKYNKPKETSLGCECLDRFKYKGKTYETCIGDSLNDKGIWCNTKDNCGHKDINPHTGENQSWDYCDVFSHYKPFFLLNNINLKNSFIIKNLLGTIILITIGLIIFFTIKKINYKLSLICLANIDLLVTTLKYNNGPYNMFTLIYDKSEYGLYSYFSKIIINTIALMGLIYLVFSYHKNIKNTMIIALIGLICTYFIPNDIIVYIQYILHSKLYKYPEKYRYIFILSISLFICYLFIQLEHTLINIFT